MGTFTAAKKTPNATKIFDSKDWQSIDANKAVFVDITKPYVKDNVYLAKGGNEQLRLALKLSNNLIALTNYRFIMVEVKKESKSSITHKSFLWSNLCYFKIGTNEVDQTSDTRSLLIKFKGYEQPIIIALDDNLDTHTLLEFLSTAHIAFHQQMIWF
jgi:hypothetical protein